MISFSQSLNSDSVNGSQLLQEDDIYEDMWQTYDQRAMLAFGYSEDLHFMPSFDKGFLCNFRLSL